MFWMEMLTTLLFLWVVMKYPTPLNVGLGLALALYLGGKHVNPAISMMKFFKGQLSQQSMLTMVGSHVAAAYVAAKFL